jgi:predicted nucleotidyltransferase
MKGTISILKKKDTDTFRVIFYGAEIPEVLNPAAAYIARRVDGLGKFLDAIGVDSSSQQAIQDALKIERSTNISDYFVPDDLLKRFGLI